MNELNIKNVSNEEIKELEKTGHIGFYEGISINPIDIGISTNNIEEAIRILNE